MKKVNITEQNSSDLYFLDNTDFDITFEIAENAKVKIFQYVVNSNGNVIINLNGTGAEVEYHYSNINKDNHEFKIIVNHNASNSISNIYNHGINLSDGKMIFDVTGKVPKNSIKCVVNQENQIINLKDGNGTILPNLLIDNYDVSSSHAAYIGKFKDDLIYYLMSRGISKEKSIKLLMESLLINDGNAENDSVLKFIKEIESI